MGNTVENDLKLFLVEELRQYNYYSQGGQDDLYH